MSRKVQRLVPEDIESHHAACPKWTVVENHHIHRAFNFPDFAAALDFVNRVGQEAEQRNHHPDILLGWGKAEITLWTHSVDGLSWKDFELARAIDELAGDLSGCGPVH